MATADFGRIDCLDISAFQGAVDPACIQARVPAGCRDVIINVDRPGWLPDVTQSNAQRFQQAGWRVSLYHELEPNTPVAQQAFTVGQRAATVQGWYRFVCVYELNPILPAPQMLTDFISAITGFCGAHRPVVNTNVSVWRNLPVDVRQFLAAHCDGMLSDYTPPTDLPADFPPLVVNQWGGIDASACCTGQTRNIDASSLSDGWAPAPAPPALGDDSMVLLVKGTADDVYAVGPNGKRHIGLDEYNAWLATGAKLQVISDAALTAIPDVVSLNQVQAAAAGAAQIVIQSIPPSSPMQIDMRAIAVEVLNELAGRLAS